jgi:arabinan endo-1,5-alpha-L-arabinosidase
LLRCLGGCQHTNPVLAGDWPDPGAIYVNGSFLVATTGGGFALHRSDDLGRWSAAGSVFNREDLPRWATGDFWAPEIHRMPDGSFNAYHTARDSAGRLSIGCATSYLSPTGPFRPLDAPLARDLEGGGMYLDSHYFFDNATSTGFLLWKHGSVTPPAETHTWLYMQPLDVSGTRLVGERLTVLRNNLSSWEAGVVEAPWIVRPPGSVDGYYYLFYSAAHCCDGSGSYAVGVARARAVTGPYEKYAQNPILASTKDAESGGFDGTGHCSVIQDPQDSRTWIIFYHAYVRPARSGARVLMMDTLRFDAVGGWPRLTTGTGSPSTKPTPLPPTKSDDDAAQPVDQRHDTAVLPRPFAVLESALAKPRPAGAYYTDQAVLQVHCAKNEVESFIVVISGGSAGLTGVTVDFTVPLAGATVSLHAARYVNATKSTGCSGATGLWADPLVPDVDVYVGVSKTAALN